MALHHVAVEGPIGVGKTTVVDRLAEKLEARKALEDWSTNPFLGPFYDGSPGAAFQTELFFLICAFIVRYEPPELHPLFDEDVAEGVGALASTFETASRGVIYEHRAASIPGERLSMALKAALADMGRNLGSAFERDAAGVLRRMATLVADVRAVEPENRRAFIEMIRRFVTAFPPPDDQRTGSSEEPPRPSSLIVP